MAGRAAVVVGCPAVDAAPGAVRPPGEEPARPVEVVAVGSGGDQIGGHAVFGQPFGEPAVLAAIILGRELAAAAPALVADSPVTNAERFAIAVGHPLVGQRGRAGRRVAVFDPLLKLLGRAGADVGREIGLDLAEPAELQELMRAKLIGLGILAPAAETPRPFDGGPMPSRQ